MFKTYDFSQLFSLYKILEPKKEPDDLPNSSYRRERDKFCISMTVRAHGSIVAISLRFNDFLLG